MDWAVRWLTAILFTMGERVSLLFFLIQTETNVVGGQGEDECPPYPPRPIARADGKEPKTFFACSSLAQGVGWHAGVVGRGVNCMCVWFDQST